MFKKYRCPHCGKETVTFGLKLLASYTPSGAHRRRGACCPACGGRFRVYFQNNIFLYLLFAVLSLIAPNVIFLLYQKFCGVPFPEFLRLLLIALSAAGAFVALLCMVGSEQPLLKYDRKRGEYTAPKKDEYNAVVSVDPSAKLKDLMVYGLIPERKTMNARFKERFRDGIIPAMFLKRKSPKGNEWLIFVIDMPEIPDEMLAPGEKISIIHQGKILGKGNFQVKKG